MNIGSGKGYPLSQLSSDSRHSFVFEGVTCASMESFMHGLKYERASQQASVCCEAPKVARERAKKAMEWKNHQVVWWRGEQIERTSSQHRKLIERAVEALAQSSEKFRQALLDTKDMELHCMTQSKEFDTPMTEAEYCAALTKIRSRLAKESLK